MPRCSRRANCGSFSRSPALAGVLLGLMSAGSAFGGLAYGSCSWRLGLTRQFERSIRPKHSPSRQARCLPGWGSGWPQEVFLVEQFRSGAALAAAAGSALLATLGARFVPERRRKG